MHMSRRSIALQKRWPLIFVFPLALVLVATVLAGCGAPVPATESVQSSLPTSELAGTPLSAGGGGSLAPAAPIFEGIEAESLEDAQSRVGFEIVLPSVVPERYQLIWIGYYPASSDGGGFARLVYSDGTHHICVSQGSSSFDPATITDEWLALLDDQRVNIGGYPGFGHGVKTAKVIWGTVEGPDTATVEIPVESLVTTSGEQIPPRIRWYPPGMIRVIWSVDDLSITIEDLIAMGESMESAQ